MEMIKTDGSQETFNSMFFFNSGELHIYLEFDKGSEFNCPVCGKPCKVYDTSSRV
jgi:transcription initiation factor IIE alpha subunit